MVLNELLLGPIKKTYLKLLLIVLKQLMWSPIVLNHLTIKKRPLNNMLAFERREKRIISEGLYLVQVWSTKLAKA